MFFDLYGTLIDIRTDEQSDAAWRSLYETVRELGSEYESVGALRERFEQLGDGSSAVCSVHTGLESPWTLTWRWDVDAGWLCTGINGPLEGAYTTLGDTAPGNVENTK